MSTAKWPRLDLKSPVFLTMLVVLVSLVLYTMTLAPGLLWGGGDFARLQTLAYTGDFSSDPTGHPLWIMVVHPCTWLPLGDVAYRANLTSAIFSTLALGLVFLADYSIYWILAYLQTVEVWRPDVRIVKIPPLGHGRQVSAITRYIQAHPVYIPDTNRYYEMADIESRFRVVQEGAVYHLLPR